MQRVLEWAEVLQGMAIELPFPEGEIEFVEEWILLKFRGEGNSRVSFSFSIHTDTDPKWRKVCDFVWDFTEDKAADLKISGTQVSTKALLGNVLIEDNTIGKLVGKFRGIMLFAAYYREEVVRTKTEKRIESSVSRKKAKRTGRRWLTLKRYTISGEMLSELSAPKKEWHGYAESFGVRGHFRRYSDGRVVWIRPYTKKGRNEKKGDREYIL
jgi:hypothetical protein